MPFDFRAVTAPFRMQPGLRRLDAGTPQLTPNRPGDAALLEKLEVLTRHPQRALLAVPGFDDEVVVRALSAQACAEHPGALQWDGARAWSAPHLGWSLRGEQLRGDGPASIGACLGALAPRWRPSALLALAFAQDFALIEATHATVPWLAVCLPSLWAPEQKLGQHFAQIHAPVADNQTLVAAGAHLARLVSGPQRWERFVWTVSRHAQLCQHPLGLPATDWPAHADAAQLAAMASFRTEHQTFIPLPSGQAIFTIHVQSQPLSEALKTPQQAQQLHAALSSMSPAVLRYRGLTDAQPRLLHWLSQWREPLAPAPAR